MAEKPTPAPGAPLTDEQRQEVRERLAEPPPPAAPTLSQEMVENLANMTDAQFRAYRERLANPTEDED